MRKKKISLFLPDFNNDEIRAATKTLRSGFWASGGGTNKVLEFETKFKKFIGAKDCVAVDSGTAALHLALSMTNLKNKEVLVPSFTFASTVNAILYNGGKPVFVDIDPNTLNIDIQDLENKITKKTSLILPVYYAGLHSSIKQVQKISKNYNLEVVSDAAHACGANFNQKKIGTEFDYVCFSFHPVINLAMPKGGMIALNGKNHSSIKKKLNSLRWCGISDRNGPFYDISLLGFNYYMEEISASIGLSQLKKLNSMNARRIKIAKRYFKELEISHKMPITNDSCYHLYWIIVKNRKKFREFMFEKGIETGIHYPSVHLMSLYRKKIKLPITEKISQDIVTLPIRSNLDDTSLNYIIKTANSYFKKI